jgi:hypothetical protein
MGGYQFCLADDRGVVSLRGVSGKVFFKEDFSCYRWAGTIIIVTGIALVALGGKSRSVDRSLPRTPHYEFTRDHGCMAADRYSCCIFA